MSDVAGPAEQAFDDVRPVVRTGAAGNWGLWVFAAVVLIGGLLLFQALSARRASIGVAATRPAAAGDRLIAPLPQLYLSRAYPEAFYPAPAEIRQVDRPVTPMLRVPPPVIGPAPASRRSSLADLGPDDLASMGLQRVQPLEPPTAAPPPSGQPIPMPAQAALAGERVTAARMINPSLTVPKGTIVAAILETALDSSRPGGTRAIVSRDVRSFDGTRVLIPRGSRLYGEYNADVSNGQKRALIRWQRLTRPDAVIINLDSPAADPLGRAGVEGKVDSHFFARFGSAILQSILDIGVGLATRNSRADNTVIVGLPNSSQQIAGQAFRTDQVQPTLRVKQGSSVSVFVNRDLDFSTVDG